MVYLPPELWLHIASFLPQDMLLDMFSVNHTFYELSMNERYHHIEFTFLLDHPHLLKRLK